MIEEFNNIIFEKVMEKLNNPENIKEIQVKLLDPIISYTFSRFSSYFMIMIIIFIITLILIIIILILLLKKIIF